MEETQDEGRGGMKTPPTEGRRPTPAEIREWLAAVPDPEIPALSVLDLGIVRDLAWEGETLVVTLTPTYTACPATAVIALDIEAALAARGLRNVRIERRLSPPWTTEWISPEGRRKLRACGIAPSEAGAGGRELAEGGARPVPCPRCGSRETGMIAPFGSTPCKAVFRCRNCLEPFDYFKCH